LLHVSHPLTWDRDLPAACFPPAGIGLLLVAWLGPPAALLVAADAFLVVLTSMILGSLLGETLGAPVWPVRLVNAALAGPEAWLAWWCYHHLARGARRLADPRSAILFLLLVPGLVTGLLAIVRAVPVAWADPGSFRPAVLTFWASNALGILSIVPPLLVCLTPALLRYGWAVVEKRAAESELRGAEFPVALRQGDWLEIIGLALGTTVLSCQIVATQEVVSWQLWTLPLLLIVWASLRQGLRGGTVVAAVSTSVALFCATLWLPGQAAVTPLQGYLLAQCSTALLVGVSFSWIQASEARYRQMVEHVPVLLYSARLVDRAGRQVRPQAFEVTFVSAASEALLGCLPRELHGTLERWLERVHAEDRELLVAAVAQLCRSREPVTCEYRVARTGPPPGAIRPAQSTVVAEDTAHLPEQRPVPPHRWLRDTLMPLVDAGGRLQGWDGVVSDITEQHDLSQDLRRTTSMFHTLVAHLPAGVFFVQAPTGRPILVNARARKLLGQHEDPSASLRHWPRVYHLFRRDGAPYPTEDLPVYVALNRGVPSMRDDIIVHRPDGRRVPLVTWAAPIDLGGHGKPDAAVWVLEDLTALDQAETARQESELRLRAIIETMAEGVVVHDGQGVIIDCNPAACMILNAHADQLRGRSFQEERWAALREDGTPFPTAEHPALVALRTGQPARGVILGLPLSASGVRQVLGMADNPVARRLAPREPGTPPVAIRWLLLNSMPLVEGHDGSSPVRGVTTFTDITAQRQILETLKHSEEKYRGLVESLPVTLIQSDRRLRVLYVNPHSKVVSGYDQHDLQEPARWQQFIHPQDLPAVLTATQEALAGRSPSLEIRYRAKDGSEKVGYCFLQPRWQGEQVVGCTTLVVDMTVQRRLEQDLQRAQRLDLIGRLAGGIAHDFNNLLTVILSLTSLARKDLTPEHPAQEYLGEILEAANQATRLAGQLLAFGRQKRIATRPLSLNQVVRQTLSMLRSSLPPTVFLDTELDARDPIVQAEETQLQQVLMNLCLNARDAMPAGGRLTVRTIQEAAGARLAVEDTGTGISEDMQTRVFEPFFSTKEHGTGLGLAVVRQIAQGLGGQVEVCSEPGNGARFEVWFPPAQTV
jgi:PAS domain S-box-containing protein